MWRSSLQCACYRYEEGSYKHCNLCFNKQSGAVNCRGMDRNKVRVFIMSFIVTYSTKPPLLRPYLER